MNASRELSEVIALPSLGAFQISALEAGDGVSRLAVLMCLFCTRERAGSRLHTGAEGSKGWVAPEDVEAVTRGRRSRNIWSRCPRLWWRASVSSLRTETK